MYRDQFGEFVCGYWLIKPGNPISSPGHFFLPRPPKPGKSTQGTGLLVTLGVSKFVRQMSRPLIPCHHTS